MTAHLTKTKRRRSPLSVYLPQDIEKWFRAKAEAEERDLSTVAVRMFRTFKAMEDAKVATVHP